VATGPGNRRAPPVIGYPTLGPVGSHDAGPASSAIGTLQGQTNRYAALHSTNHSTSRVSAQRDPHIPQQSWECPRQDSNLRRPGLGALHSASADASMPAFDHILGNFSDRQNHRSPLFHSTNHSTWVKPGPVRASHSDPSSARPTCIPIRLAGEALAAALHHPTSASVTARLRGAAG
jgi:hypothetical protein